jgi:predicted nuclease of predicted toxin-antitoxin system
LPVKFKVDKNLPIEVAQPLREAGHDVYSVHDQGLVGAKDQVLAEVCRSENRIMVTLDAHFADIRTYPPENYSGLIVLRLERQDKPHVLEVMQRVLKLFSTETLEGKLWIVDEKRVRVRG